MVKNLIQKLLPDFSRWQTARAVAAVLAGGFGFTLLIFFVTWRMELRRLRDNFAKDAAIRAVGIQEVVKAHRMDVGDIVRFFDGSASVERDEFSVFVRPMLSNCVIAWLPRVRPEEKGRLALSAKKEGIADFRIRDVVVPFQEPREFLYPVFYIEPYPEYGALMGLDIASLPEARDCMEKARRLGGAVTTGLVSLPGVPPSLLLFKPVYAKGAAGAGKEAQGFIMHLWQAKSILEEAILPSLPLGLPTVLLDLDGAPERQRLHFWGPRQRTPSDAEKLSQLARYPLCETFPFSFAERKWRIDIYAGNGYVDSHFSRAHGLVLPAGILLTLLLALHIRTLVSHGERAEQLVRERTAELQKAKEEIEGKAAELERANADLQQLLFASSHDLKEPLRLVGSYLELIQMRHGEKLGPEGQDYMRRAIAASRRMYTLIHNLFEYIGLSRKAAAFQEVDCALLLRGVLEDLRLAIEESRAQVAWENLPVIRAIEPQMRSLFQNLIGNALKYRGADPPRIRVEARRDGREWIFSVRDNGIGIDPKYFGKLFKLFSRLHAGENYSGTGVGLAVCKRIVQIHGGRIWVESRSNGGTTFYFSIPDQTA